MKIIDEIKQNWKRKMTNREKYFAYLLILTIIGFLIGMACTASVLFVKDQMSVLFDSTLNSEPGFILIWVIMSFLGLGITAITLFFAFWFYYKAMKDAMGFYKGLEVSD